MPNWCSNSAVLKHKDPTFIARAREAFNQGALLNEFIPVPKDLQIVSGRCGADDNPEQIALELAQKNNIDVHGYKDWYDFCVNEWGTKWDVGADGQPAQDIDGGLMLNFESAWAPPIAAYEKLKSMGFDIEANYYESGMSFVGEWIDGEDIFYQIEGNSEWVRENIPEHLDEAFAISEGMEQWEEENEEN